MKEVQEQNIEKKVDDKIKTTNIKGKKILILFVLLIVVIYVLYAIYLLIKQPTKLFTVEEGTLYEEGTEVGYIIRSEQIVKGNNYKNGMEQIKAEKEKAAKGEAIFRYYSKNEEELKKKIAELDVKIQEVMSSQTEAFSTQINVKLKQIEDQIDQKILELNKITDTAKLTEYKKEIDSLVLQKAKIAGDLSPKGSYLKELNNQRAEYEKQLNSGAEYVQAPASGIVSYKVDGLEEKLTPDNFSVLSKEFLEGLNLKTGKIVATNNEYGKIVDNFSCYIATITTAEEAKEAKVDDNVKIRLSNNVEVDATISYISQENENEMLLVLKITKQIEELIDYRKITFDLIWWKYSGLKVPNQAIATEDGLNYVVRNRAGYLNKILVKSAKQNDKYAIVKSYDTDELKELGFSDKEILSYKKISIYDEILLNPDLQKVEE